MVSEHNTVLKLRRLAILSMSAKIKCIVKPRVEGLNVSWVCWRRGNTSALCGRPALIPSRNRRVTYGRRTELQSITRRDSQKHP